MNSQSEDEPNRLTPPHSDLESRFEIVLRRLLSGETLDLYAEGVSLMFDRIAADMLAEIPARKYHWFDGVVGLEAVRKTSRQVEFTGEMWVGDEKKQWKEDFRATVTDKRITKQGLWIILCIGSDRAEADLLSNA